jgi:two-component system NtrC family sensor kinase
MDGPADGRSDLRVLASRAVAESALVAECGDGGRVLLAVPLTSHDDAIGALVFAVPGSRLADGGVRSLVETLGKQVGVAVEEARLQEELAATKSYLQDLVENAGDEVVTIDRDGRLRTWNGGAEALYGHSREEVIGRGWELLWPEDRHEEARALVRRVVDDGETVTNHETVRRTASGGFVDILLTLSPLREPAGRIRGVSCLGKDLTYRKQLQAQLVQSEKMVAVGQLISGVAHELNNPLTAVLGYAQLVSSADTGAKLPTYLGRISAEAGRCQRIVQNLLAFARKHEPRAVPSDLNQVVRATLDLRRYDLRVNDVEIVEDLAPNLPWTLADPHQLQQVFINIVNNAQHAIRSVGRAGRLLVRTRFERGSQGEAAIVVSFHDSGPGVPRELRERVFDPFYTTKEVGEGTGLGLSLSYGIVQEHGGTLATGDSEEGGACFSVRLPVLPDPARQADRRAAADARPAAAERDAVAPAQPPPERPRRRILVVDDQDSVREVFLDVLSADGHDVDLAADGREALRLIEDGRPYDLLIVDLKMPAFGGDRLYETLAAERPDLARRVLFATGDILSQDSRRFVERAGGRLLEKPFGIDEVRSTVHSFFEDRP